MGYQKTIDPPQLHKRDDADLSTDHHERRRSYRQPLLTVGVLFLERHPSEHAQPIQVMVRDVSLHGVGFRASISFEKGAIYYIHIGVGPLHLSSRTRIVQSRLRSDGTYDIGAEFV
jgi:hypothetical protein